MSEEKFWKCTPRKLIALTLVHIQTKQAEMGGSNTSKNATFKPGEWPSADDPRLAYIDQVV